MKKVPVLGQVESGIDKSIKDVMGPMKMFYSPLKFAAIASSSTLAVGYLGYRAIPYVIDALKSKSAVNAYKKVGKAVGKASKKAVVGISKLSFKFAKESALALGNMALKLGNKAKNYISAKNNERIFDNNMAECNLDIENENLEYNFDEEYNIENDYETEPQLNQNESYEIEVSDNEELYQTCEVSHDCTFRFTRTPEGNLRQYIHLGDQSPTQGKDVTVQEYAKFIEDYNRTLVNEREDEHTITYDDELER